ncbi:MAG TPA: hypothetical protein VN784_07300 [Candidatus Limnocylindrales bacterium]|nr:hypothetical protein [Candidatus Limnocylindrales bacterium]
MKTVSGELGASGEAELPTRSKWPLSRWLLLILIVLAAHIALIFIFGTRKPITPMPVKNAPKLELAVGSSEWLMLNDPTLFALPNIEGFAGPAWLEPPHVQFHQLEWTESPRWLQLPAGELGAVFSRFMETNRFATLKLELKPPPPFTVPLVPLEPQFAVTSTLRIEGDIARRPLLAPMKLPSWPYTDVIAPSKVQVLVNATGEVVSAVLLPSDDSGEVRDAEADGRALELARAARFAPASDLTLGKLIFNWCTVPPPATNAPSGL